MTIALAIAWFSHQPDWPGPARGYPDWLLHGLAFGSLAVCLVWGLTCGFPALRISLAHFLGALLLASLYGALDELHQSFVPSRDAAISDWVADTLGAGGALVALVVTFAALRGLWENPPHPSPPAKSRPDQE